MTGTFWSVFSVSPRSKKHRGAASTTTTTPALLLFFFTSERATTIEGYKEYRKE
jgi:hypothetical protein